MARSSRTRSERESELVPARRTREQFWRSVRELFTRTRLVGLGGYGEHVSDPVPITRSLDSMMKSLRGTDRLQVAGVFGKWDRAVGDPIAAHVRPVKLDGTTLVVAADTATWATQVKFLSDTIITRLRDEAGVVIDRVEVRVGSPRPS